MSDTWTVTSGDAPRNGRAMNQSSLERMRNNAERDLAQFIYRPDLRAILAVDCTPSGRWDELRIEPLRARPEFRHWNDPRYGKEDMAYDLWLLSTGRETLESLFRDGAIGTREERLWVSREKQPLGTCIGTRRIDRQSEDSRDQYGRADYEDECSEVSNRYVQRSYLLESPYLPHPNTAQPYHTRADVQQGKMPKFGRQSSWNDVLRVAGIDNDFNDTRGDIPVTWPPPRGFPGLHQLTMPLKLNVRFMHSLPEFRHWHDASIGCNMRKQDLRLFDTGRISLVYLFLRGAVYPWWYRLIEATTRFENRNAYAVLVKLADFPMRAYDAEVSQVEDDFHVASRICLEDVGFGYKPDEFNVDRRDARNKRPSLIPELRGLLTVNCKARDDRALAETLRYDDSRGEGKGKDPVRGE